MANCLFARIYEWALSIVFAIVEPIHCLAR